MTSRTCHRFIEDLCRRHKKLQHTDIEPSYFRWFPKFQEYRDKPKLAVVGEPTRLKIGHDDVALKETPMVRFKILQQVNMNDFAEAEDGLDLSEQVLQNFVTMIDAMQQGEDPGTPGCSDLLAHLSLTDMVADEVGPFHDGYFGWEVMIPFTNAIELEHDQDAWD